MPIVKLTDVQKSYSLGKAEVPAVKGVSFSIEKGDFISIAGALVTRPAIVLADEPTANLDSKTGEAIIGLMKDMNRELSTTFIFSTHDQTIVRIADHVIELHDGLIAREVRNGAEDDHARAH